MKQTPVSIEDSDEPVHKSGEIRAVRVKQMGRGAVRKVERRREK